MNFDADFFITSAGESFNFFLPRACKIVGRVSDGNRDCFALTKVYPSVLNDPNGKGSPSINLVVLGPRAKDLDFFPILRWPLPVKVFEIIDPSIINPLEITRSEQVRILAWAMLYKDFDEAFREADLAIRGYAAKPGGITGHLINSKLE